ncbi:MAG: hypothetical protein ACKO96_01440 [Flammeovirgaceae bacterium]
MSEFVQKLTFYLSVEELSKIKGLTVNPSLKGLVLTLGINAEAKVAIDVTAAKKPLVAKGKAATSTPRGQDKNTARAVPNPPGHS